MQYYKDDWQAQQPEKKLKVIIVGAGIAGLSTAIGRDSSLMSMNGSDCLAGLKQSGHTPIVLEQVKEIAEVGAGIQLAPNNTRILGRFGCLSGLMEKTNILERNSLRRWKDNEELGTAPLMPGVCKTTPRMGKGSTTDRNNRLLSCTRLLSVSSTEAICK